jgi:hypothetical protein
MLHTYIRIYHWVQGCQIFLDTIYQKGRKYTKLPLNYQTAIKYTKCPEYIPNVHRIGIPNFSIPRPSNIYPNWYFWFENIPSGNPDWVLDEKRQKNAFASTS